MEVAMVLLPQNVIRWYYQPITFNKHTIIPLTLTGYTIIIKGMTRLTVTLGSYGGLLTKLGTVLTLAIIVH
jgi:hypothetical protein